MMPSFSSLATASVSNTTETSLIAAPGAAACINLTHLVFSNTDAANSCNVSVKFGGTTVWAGLVVPAGLAHTFAFTQPVRLDANQAVTFQSDASVSTLYANAAYFLHPNG